MRIQRVKKKILVLYIYAHTVLDFQSWFTWHEFKWNMITLFMKNDWCLVIFKVFSWQEEFISFQKLNFTPHVSLISFISLSSTNTYFILTSRICLSMERNCLEVITFLHRKYSFRKTSQLFYYEWLENNIWLILFFFLFFGNTFLIFFFCPRKVNAFTKPG